MSSAKDSANDYRTTLSELTCNNKTQINMLTILAEDYKDYSPFIVDVIEEELFKSSPQRKILILYVIDSIVKNLREASNYPAHFSTNIVKIFEHVFQESDEKTRLSLHKLRQTWTDYFPRGKLYAIDTKINAIDRAWPVASVSGGARINGHNTAIVKQEPLHKTVHLNPKFLNQNEKVETKTAQQQSIMSKRKLKVEVDDSVTAITANRNGSAKTEAPKNLLKSALKKPRTNSPVKITYDRRQNNLSKQQISNHLSVQNHSTMASTLNSKPQPLMAKPIAPPAQISPLRDVKPILPSTGISTQTMPKETQRLGSHAFVDVKPIELQSGVFAPKSVSPALTIQNSITTPLIPSIQTMANFIPPSRVPPAVVAASGSMTGIRPMMFENVPVNTPPTTMFMPMQTNTSTISNETPRINMMANNRVFVDGKAYDVHFLHDIPVIIRNGLPHRVSFSGPPRDVIIDGVAHRLAFGESKTVIIDGESHVLRFGAPSRELYMGNFPFKGVFGGPPIIATINGRRHEIRLTGTPPEAKIEQDPSYELARYMDSIPQTNNANVNPLTVPGPKIESSKNTVVENVSTLLRKLQHSGLIQSLLGTKDSKPASSTNISSTVNADSLVRNTNSPPIPSTQRLDNIERRVAPMSDLDQFSMRSLVIRYDSVIEALHKPRLACQYCGISIKELYSEPYQQHIAWHLKEIDGRLKGDKYTQSRQWYMTDDWFIYSETELANRITANVGDKTVDDQIASGSNVTNGDALSSAVNEKDCCVCNEKFEEYYDEDDDAWKLRDCVVEDGKAFHRYCKTDISFSEQTSSANVDTNSNNEILEEKSILLPKNYNFVESKNQKLLANLCNINDTNEMKQYF